MNRKVKVGDKIRLLTNVYYDQCKPGDVLTVVLAHGDASVSARHEPTSMLLYFNGTEYEVLTETPPAETELERLVRVANEGFKAADRIYSMGLQEQIECGADNKEYRSVISVQRSPGWNYRIKPKPTFEPFYVGPHDQPVPHNHPNGEPAWLVKLEGDTLHVGCQEFSAIEVVCALKAFDAGSNADCSFRCHRHGVYTASMPTNIISWADADRILAALEKAGV